MEEQLRHSQGLLAEAHRIGRIGTWEWTIADDRITWSEEMYRICGVTPDDFDLRLGGYFEMVHPEDRAMARLVIENAVEQGGTFAFEHRVVRPDGEVRTVFGRGEVFRDLIGTPIRLAGTGQDVTDRKRMEQELQRSEERFRLAFTHTTFGKAIVAPDRRILQVNPAACCILGYSEEELIGLDSDSITHEDDRVRTGALVQRLLAGPGIAGGVEGRFLTKNGKTVWCRLTATIIRDPEDKPLYFIAEFEDVTERRRAEEALRESEERFRNLYKQAPVMMMSFAPDGRIRDVSNYWLQTTGYSRDEVVGKDGFSFITEDSRQRLQAVIDENTRNNEVVIRNQPLQGIRRDGTTIDLLCTSVAEVGDDGSPRGAICVQINLTDLRRAEEALRESEERYRALVEYAPEAIMVLDVELDRFVDANPPAEKLFGFSRERLLTMGPLDFCPERQADRRASCEVVHEEHQKVLAGGTSVFEFTHVDASGREIVCETRLARLPAAGRKLIRATITDVSELRELQEKVRHAEKLAAVGVLAAGVAHEIGNPLMALSMAAQNLERRTKDDYAVGKLALIREHIDRIARIVRQMSDLARPPSGRRASCDLNQIVRRAVEMVRYDKRAKQAEVVYELAEGLPPVEVVEDEMIQVCINLALNAFDAMAGNPPDRERKLTVRSEVHGGSVRVAFLDTGPGVPRELRSKLFQPFFTTKEVGQGSGLGLSVSHRILREHDGSLTLDEAAPGGAFVFSLPIGARS
jgi:PAS domain S-box-containing protein